LRLRGLIVLPLLSRLYPQEVYGAWLQILLVSEFLSQILSLRLGTAIVRYLSGEKDPKIVIRAAFTVISIISMPLIACSIIFGDWLSQLIFSNQNLNVLVVPATIWILTTACLKIGMSALRAYEKISQVSAREVISVAWLILSVCCAYLLKIDLQNLILLCAVGDILVLIWILFEAGIPCPIISIPTGIAVLKKYLRYSTPLLSNTFLLWFTRSVDRFLVVHLIGLSAVGVYGVSFQFASLLFAVLRPVNFVLFPRASKAWNEGEMIEVNRSFSQAVSFTFMLSAPVIVGIFTTAEGFIRILAGAGYLGGTTLIFLLMLSCVASMIYQNHLYIVHLVEKTYWLPVLFICSSVFNLILGYLLTSQLGLVGAALSRIVTLALMAVAVTLYARRHINFLINWNLILRVGLASILMGLTVFWIPMDSWYLLMLKILIGMVTFLFYLYIMGVATKENFLTLKSQF
jgi:O-antigen/teichoic acid export membrane protein